MRLTKNAAVFCFGALAAAALGAETSMWKVSKDGASLYLGGTVHILRESDYPLPPAFSVAFDAADMVILEAPELDAEETMRVMLDKWLLPSYLTLKDALGESAYRALEEFCDEQKIPIGAFSRFKPYPVLTLITAGLLAGLQYSAPGVDKYFQSRAEETGKPIAYLESAEYQMELLADLGMEYGEAYFLSEIESFSRIDETREKMAAMIDDWKAGRDVGGDLLEMRERFPAVYAALMYGRNMAWLNQIEGYLKTPPVEMVLVGSAHLYGPDGLLLKLVERGCAVRQLR